MGRWAEGIHPHYALRSHAREQARIAYMRRTGATALPLHWDDNLNRWELRLEVVDWGRDGF
jgi:hypothetical protein